jgi:hypothetical protein
LIEKVLGVEFASAKEFATVNGLMQIWKNRSSTD